MARKSQWEKAKELYKEELKVWRAEYLKSYELTFEEYLKMSFKKQLEALFGFNAWADFEEEKKRSFYADPFIVYGLKFSYGANSLIYNGDIAIRILTPSNFKKWNAGKLEIDLLEVQGRCIAQAAKEIMTEEKAFTK